MRKFLSFALALFLIASMTLPALAVEISANKIVPEVILEMDNVRIEYYEDSNGDRVFLQYVNNVLTHRSTIAAGQGEYIISETITGENVQSSSTIDSSSIITTLSYNEYQVPSPRISMGTINYCAVLDTGPIYYSLSCSCEEYVSEGEYTINGYIGPLVDLVAILVLRIPIVAKYATSLLGAIITGMGITYVAGEIKSALTTTVSCNRHDFVWILTEVGNTSHRENVTGASYYTYDTGTATHRAYFEGYTPRDWGTSAMATRFHNEMFAHYDTWHVVSWS